MAEWAKRTGEWRRSSFHKPTELGDAVECYLYGDGVIGLRDARHHTDGRAVLFGPEAWQAFINGVKVGEFDIGEPVNVTSGPCDAAEWGGHPSASTTTGECRCVVCARCGHHTGNSHQGHLWRACKVLSARLRAEQPPGTTLPLAEMIKRTVRGEFHFCCPDPAYGCELEEADDDA